jgi:general secretion pathway protein I
MQALRPEFDARGGDGGFSLLEVLFALMIFAIAAVMLSSSYLNVLTSYVVVGKGSGAEQDIAFARHELLTQADPVAAAAGDEFDAPQGDPSKPRTHIKWTADIEPANTTDLFNVTFTCVVTTSDATTPARTVTEVFTLLRPTWYADPTMESTLRQAAIQRIMVLQGKATQ